MTSRDTDQAVRLDEAADRRCRACGAPGGEPVVLREMMFGTRESFDYRRCDACRSIWIVDVPPDLDRHYPPSYYARHSRRGVTRDPVWRQRAIRTLAARRLFGRHSPWLPIARRIAKVPKEFGAIRDIVVAAGVTSFDDPILDVGCGSEPDRLAMLHRLGFRRLLGVEPYIDADAVYGGVAIKKGELGEVDGRFRLIMFHHSLEHVPDPMATLRQARARLDPAGRCLVRTPVADGWLWRRYGPHWVELDAPRHLVVISRVGMERLAARAGFMIESVTWESGAWEFIASERYQQDIAMHEPGTPSGDQPADPRLEEFRAEAAQRIEEGDSGRAAFWLRPIEPSPSASDRHDD